MNNAPSIAVTGDPTDDFRTVRLRLDLDALTHNHETIKARTRPAELAPVVKANAYGLGIERIAPHLWDIGARTFFVARLVEGVKLRSIVPDAVIYVLDGFEIDQHDIYSACKLRPVINSLTQLEAWQHYGGKLPFALHIDTGMNRLGLSSVDFNYIKTNKYDENLTLIMSHMACAEAPAHPMNALQLSRLLEARDHFPGVPLSLSASAGCFLGPDYALDMVRPGISLYGGGPLGEAHPDIRPVAHLTARVLQVRTIAAGDTVGYGATFTATEPMQIATIGMGYADGLLRHYAASGTAFVGGEKRRLLGRISMDVFSLDVTGLTVKPGDNVELLGIQQNLDTVASHAGTIAYEVLTRLGERMHRI